MPPPLRNFHCLARQFHWFVAIFHTVFIAGLVCTMVVRYRRPGFAWSTMDSWLVLLVAAQVALYVWFFVLHPQSTRPAQWGAYFISAFAIWIIEWRMEPALVWVCLPLLGQISGVMPARISVSATVLVVLIFLGFTPRAQLANISLWEWFGIIAMAISVATLGMFLHRLSITSAERAELITQLQEAQQKLEAARTRDAELAVLRERERLARDLHDNLGHYGLRGLRERVESLGGRFHAGPVDDGGSGTLIEAEIPIK